MSTDQPQDQEGNAQHNFVESRDPAELFMCFILAAAYLGLSKYCWGPLMTAQNWKLLVNIEGFFITIAVLSILVGLRPYMSPSSLQISSKGIKYRAPYWPQRKTVNWDQIVKVYLSPELIVILYHPQIGKPRIWPMVITSIYLADRDRIRKTMFRFCPKETVAMSSPHLVSWVMLGLGFLAVVIWVLEMLVAP